MKSSLLLLGLMIPLSLLAPAGGFGETSIQIGIGVPVAAYHYWYYPERGVYYDYGAHVYFYLDGPNWVRVAHLPPRFHGLGRHVIVESEHGRPWAKYESHRAKYPPGQWKKERREDDRDRGPGHDHGKRHFDDDRH